MDAWSRPGTPGDELIGMGMGDADADADSASMESIEVMGKDPFGRPWGNDFLQLSDSNSQQ
jgi:hypothetical protein